MHVLEPSPEPPWLGPRPRQAIGSATLRYDNRFANGHGFASFECLQVSDQRLKIVRLQRIRAHAVSRLNSLRVDNPAGQRPRRIRKGFRGDHLPARNVREIRTQSRSCIGSAYGVAHHASMRQKHIAAMNRDKFGGILRGLELLRFPLAKCIFPLSHNREAHVGMLQPAEFRTLAVVHTRLVDLKPERRGVTGQEVALAINAGCPEAMYHVSRIRENYNPLSHRHMNLIGGGNRLVRLRVGIDHFPPPLMAYHLNRDTVFRSLTLNLLSGDFTHHQNGEQR